MGKTAMSRALQNKMYGAGKGDLPRTGVNREQFDRNFDKIDWSDTVESRTTEQDAVRSPQSPSKG